LFIEPGNAGSRHPGKRLADGETIGLEGQPGFTVSHADSGDFVSFPVARLGLLQANK
jgi:hypothetical protein